MQVPLVSARPEKRHGPCQLYSSSLRTVATQLQCSSRISSTTAATCTRSLGTVRRKDGNVSRLLSRSVLAP